MDSELTRLRRQLLLQPKQPQAWESLARDHGIAITELGHGASPPWMAADHSQHPAESDAAIHQRDHSIPRSQPTASAPGQWKSDEDIFQQAKVLIDLEQFQDAIDIIEAWLPEGRDDISHPMLCFLQAHAYRKLNQPTRALDRLEALRLEASSAWIPFELGLIYRDLGRNNDAYLCFNQAREIEPDFAWAAIEAKRLMQETEVALGHLDEISAQLVAGSPVRVHLDRSVRCGSLLLLIGWCDEPLASGTLFRLSDILLPGVHAIGSGTFYHRPDVCQALGLPEQHRHGFAALLDCAAVRRRAEHSRLRLLLEPEGEDAPRQSDSELCLAEVDEETNLARFLEAVLGSFRVAIDSGNGWPEALKLFSAQTALQTASLFTRHVTSERDRVEIHWLSQAKSKSTPMASVIFVQLGSFISALPAIVQLAKSGLPLELIIVNNSPELFAETFHILDRFARIRPGLRIGILNRELNLGFSAGCNLGAAHANGECLLFHNNDLFADSGENYKLLIERALHEDKAIHSAFQYFTDGTLMQEGLAVTRLTTARAQSIPLFNGFSVGRNQTRAEIIACSGSLMAMHASLFRQLGGFSEEYVYAHFEDLDLCLRAREQSIPVRVWNDLKFFHAEGSGSVAPYHLTGTTSHINRLMFSLKWRQLLEGMELTVEYSL